MAESVFTELIEKELQKPITNAKQSYRVIELSAMGLVSVHREVYSISKELYGNGIPGGLKLEVASIKSAQNETQKDVNDLKRLLSSGVSPVKTVVEEPKLSWADSFIKWFVDKVLPALVVTILLGIANVIFWVIAVKNGWIGLQ